MTPSPDMTMSIGQDTFTYKECMIASTKHEQQQVTLSDSDVVFVGFGVNAPEYGWNDYQDLDVKGKMVVILVNAPGFENPDSGKFEGKTRPASCGWSVVANSWSGPQYSLLSANGNADRVAVQGWLSADAARQLFRPAGLNFAEQKAKALAGPYHQSLNVKASVTINAKMQKSISHNVIATLPGSRSPGEHLIYSAHWDHWVKMTARRVTKSIMVPMTMPSA
jgi:Zn-dependent M28 family amino/carboxypeptidase